MNARPPQRLRHCQLHFTQDGGPAQRCQRPPRHLVELSQGERSERKWVCRIHADQRSYAGSGVTVRLVAPEVADLIADDDGNPSDNGGEDAG